MHTGRFIWHDLITPDLEGSKAFYTAVLGWQIVEWGGPEDDPFPQPYTMHQAGGAPMPQGGFIPMEGQRASWFANVITDDADALAARVAPAGGTVMRGPFDIPTVGRNVIVQDPQGAQLGCIAFFGEGMAPPTAPAPAGTFVWDELMTTDTAAAAAFYRAVIGWTSAPFDGPVDYSLFSAGDVQTAGMMKLEPGMPEHPFWLPYVNVDDLDATARLVEQHNGKLVAPPFAVPGVGRIAIIEDAQGAGLGLLQPEMTS